MLAEGLARAEQDRAAVVGAGHDERDGAGLEPHAGVAAQAEEQQDGVIRPPGRAGAVNGRLDGLPQLLRVDMLAQLDELQVQHMGRARGAVAHFALEDVARDQLQDHGGSGG